MKAFSRIGYERSPEGIIQAIIQVIKDFEASIGEQHFLVCSFPGIGMVRLTSVAALSNCLILFDGTGIGNGPKPVRIVQHINQVNLAMSIQPLLPDQIKEPIGFKTS